jgi:putative Mg2+ transporter-C (MgtC) family protein
MGTDTIDRYIVSWFNAGFNGAVPAWLGNFLLMVLCLVASVFFSGVIGFEREYHGHSAGLRTHLLVSVGSALIMIISIYGFPYATTTAGAVNYDPGRLAAQVVSGIGFLGAGTIVQTGTDVKGLTTATTLWVVMAIGLACGSGNFVVAATATTFAFICLVSMRKVEKLLAKRNPVIMIVVPSDKPSLKDIILIANRYSISIRDTQSELVSYQENSALRIIIHCSFATQSSITAFADEIRFTLRPLELKVSTDTQ